MSALFLELNRTVLFLSSLLAPHEEGAKAIPVVRLKTIKLLVPVDAVVGLAFLSQPLQTNTWQLCCKILCWLSVCKDLKALSQTLQG